MSTTPEPNQAQPAPARPAPRPAARPAPQAAAAQPADAQPQGEAEEEGAEYEGGAGGFLLFTAVPSWLVSMLVHIILLLMMAFFTFKLGTGEEENMLTVQEPVEAEEIEDIPEPDFENINVETDVVANVVDPQPETDNLAEEPDFTPADDLEQAAIHVELSEFGEETAPRNDLMSEIGAITGSGLEGRGAGARSGLVQKYGGNPASEAAVARALKWLAAHQLRGGSWNFDHRRGGPSQKNPGSAAAATRGATGLALLPFLGAGQTHKEGKYQTNVRGGLVYLVRTMQVNPNAASGSMHEKDGSMYSHGLASIALCEAYAMTQDKDLLQPAQLALNFIAQAQDPVGGGWRYEPRQAGDTSVVGWQLMALKSGNMAYLQVNPNTVRGAMKFLDSVQSESGAKYGYTGPGGGPATTAIGLLCRMYLGWKRDHGALQQGIEHLSKTGPSDGNMYFNYYATQVLRHNRLDSDPKSVQTWDKWNTEMRDYLIASQDKHGNENGSWYFTGGDHGAQRGGRLYCTAMAAMILEVYYRHLPIYRKQASEDEFQL